MKRSYISIKFLVVVKRQRLIKKSATCWYIWKLIKTLFKLALHYITDYEVSKVVFLYWIIKADKNIDDEYFLGLENTEDSPAGWLRSSRWSLGGSPVQVSLRFVARLTYNCPPSHGMDPRGREERRVQHAGQEGQQRGQGGHQDRHLPLGPWQGGGQHLGCHGRSRRTGLNNLE